MLRRSIRNACTKRTGALYGLSRRSHCRTWRQRLPLDFRQPRVDHGPRRGRRPHGTGVIKCSDALAGKLRASGRIDQDPRTALRTDPPQHRATAVGDRRVLGKGSCDGKRTPLETARSPWHPRRPGTGRSGTSRPGRPRHGGDVISHSPAQAPATEFRPRLPHRRSFQPAPPPITDLPPDTPRAVPPARQCPCGRCGPTGSPRSLDPRGPWLAFTRRARSGAATGAESAWACAHGNQRTCRQRRSPGLLLRSELRPVCKRS
jgi:hypothetical protein